MGSGGRGDFAGDGHIVGADEGRSEESPSRNNEGGGDSISGEHGDNGNGDTGSELEPGRSRAECADGGGQTAADGSRSDRSEELEVCIRDVRRAASARDRGCERSIQPVQSGRCGRTDRNAGSTGEPGVVEGRFPTTAGEIGDVCGVSGGHRKVRNRSGGSEGGEGRNFDVGEGVEGTGSAVGCGNERAESLDICAGYR